MTVNRIFLTEEETISEIRESMRVIGTDLMPTSIELKAYGKEYLHNKISRTKGYRGWAEYLGLEMKQGATRLGAKYEDYLVNKLQKLGHETQSMTTKHPYDIYVDNAVKIDVKVANPYKINNYTVHTFRLSKEYPTCDIYVLIALDYEGEIQRELVVPSKFLNQKMVSIGANSIYDKYNERYGLVKKYSDFFGGITA